MLLDDSPGHRRSLRDSALFALVVLAQLTFTQLARAQSVANYGFESGTLSSWAVENGATATVGTSTVHSGSYSAVTTGAGNAGLYQAVSGLIAGQQYVVSAWVNVTAGQMAALYANDSVTNATAESADQGTTNGWQSISLPFTADSTGTVGIHLWSVGAGTIYWDDVSVVQAVSVANYGFESGTLSSWAVENGATASIVTSTVHSGSYSAVTTGAGNAGLYQAVSGLIAGQQYVVSAWVNVTAGQMAALYANDSVTNATAESADQGTTNGWQYISLPFTADSTGTVGIHLWSVGAGTIYWDDVSVVQAVPMANYGFESGTLSSWAVENGATASIVTSTVHSGSYSAATTGAGNAGLYQAVSGLIAGRQYVVSAWVNVTAGQMAALYVNDSVSNATAESADQWSTNGWQYISLPFTADSTGEIGIHLWSAGAGTIYWDDISILGNAAYTISGQVLAGSSGLLGATVTLAGTIAAGASVSMSTTTDSSGSYSFTVPSGGTYAITPSFSGYTFSPASQNFSDLTSAGNAIFNVLTGITSGAPAPPSVITPPPNIAPPSVVTGSATNCNDISGTWTDANSDTFTLSQTGSSVSGSTTNFNQTCGNVTWTITGQMTGAGSFSLTESNPQPAVDSCGEEVQSGQTAAIQITSCSSAQETYTGSGSGGSSFVGGGSGSTGATSTWTRSTNPPSLEVAVDLYNATVTLTPSGQNKTGELSATLSAGTEYSYTLGQTANAGSGTSQSYSIPFASLQPSQYSQIQAQWDGATLVGNTCELPPGGTQGTNGNTFVKVNTVAGSCNKTLYSGSSIAVNPNPNTAGNPSWNCQDKVMLSSPNSSANPILAVQDYCPACSGDFRGQNGHIDTYNSNQACDGHSLSDYGNFTAIRLR